MLRLIILCFTLIFISTSAHAVQDARCGMIITESGEKVESLNSDICPEDVAFQGLYLLYQDIFDDPFFNSIAKWFVTDEVLDNSFTRFASNQIGISSVIYPLLSAVAILGWAIMGPLLIFKVYQYTAMVKKTGKLQFAETKGDTVRFVSYFGLIVGLSLPVNSIMLGQGLSIVLSLPSIMGGNYIFSTYMSGIRDVAAEVKLDNEILLMTSQTTASQLINSAMCQDRTRKALFTINGANFGDFYNSEWAFISQGDVHDTYTSCLAYNGVATLTSDGKTIKSLGIEKAGVGRKCMPLRQGRSVVDKYIDIQHGMKHNCGRITFNTSKDNYQSVMEETHSELDVDMTNVIDDVTNAFSVTDYYLRHKQTNGPALSAALNNETMTDLERMDRLTTLTAQSTAAIQQSLSSNPLLSRGNIEELQIMHLAAGGALLGNRFSTTVDTFRLVPRVDNKHYNVYFGADPQTLDKFDIEPLLDDAKKAAKLIQAYHCAMNWQNYADIRLEIAKFNSNTDPKKAFSTGMPSMECIEILPESERGSTDLDRYWRYAVNDPKANNDIIKSETGLWVKKTDIDNETQDYMVNEKAKKLYREIRFQQLIMASYFASVQKALANNLMIKMAVQLDDRESNYDIRSRGFAGFGGALLYLNKVHTSSAHMSSAISSILNVEADGEQGNYINFSAFPEAKEAEIVQRVTSVYSDIRIDGALSSNSYGVIDYPGPSGLSDEEEEDIQMKQFLGYVERWVMSPFDHIKETGGLPGDRRLIDGFKECFKNGDSNCISSQRHPMTSMMRFGDELMNNMLNIMLVRYVVKAINRATLGTGSFMEGQGGSVSDADKAKKDMRSHKKSAGGIITDFFKSMGKAILGVVGKLLSIITLITIPIESILDFFLPFVILLFVAGALFAYMVPLTAFLYGFMLLALWYLSVAVIAFVWPFYAVMKLLKIEVDYKRGFQELYESYLGPYLRPFFYSIAAVLAFSFMYITVFVTNTIFGLIYESMDQSDRGWGITSLLFEVFIYAMYLVTIFVMFRYCLGIMKSFPDMMMSKLRLQRSNDERFIDSLGFETYVNASIIKELAQNSNSFGNEKLDQYKMNKSFKEFNDMILKAGGPAEFAKALEIMNTKDTLNQGSNGQSSAPQNNFNDVSTDNSNNADEALNAGSSSASDLTPGSAPSANSTETSNSNTTLPVSEQGQAKAPNAAGDNQPKEGEVKQPWEK